MATKEQKVKGDELVKVKYTAKAKYHKTGEESQVHELQAEKLVEKGFATIVDK